MCPLQNKNWQTLLEILQQKQTSVQFVSGVQLFFVYGYLSSLEDESYILIQKTMNVFSTDRFNMSLLLFLLHTIYKFDDDLMYFCRFTLQTILHKKMPDMWSLFRDHTAGDHIQTNYSM